MTSLNRRRRKKEEKKSGAVARRETSWRYGYDLPAPPVRPQDSALIAEIEDAIETRLDLSGIDLERVAGLKSVAFGRRNGSRFVPLVYVFADEAAEVRGVGQIAANFRKAGAHWSELRELLVHVQGGLAPPDDKAYDVLMTSVEPLATELVASASQASARIRADLRVFPCPVVLEGDPYLVRFEPVRRFPRLLVPFRIERSGELLAEAALDLTSTTDPIAVACDRSADATAVIEAWPVALLAFADLIGDHASGDTERGPERTEERVPARHRRPGGTPRRLSATTQSRSTQRSSRLTKQGETPKHQGTYVVGHRRHLPPGQSCKDDARAAARVYGINLAPGWTWVAPHVRGVPSGFVLRYAWHAPPQLARGQAAA